MGEDVFFRNWGKYPDIVFAEVIMRKEYASHVKVHGLVGFVRMLSELSKYYQSRELYRKCFSIQTLQLGIKLQYKHTTTDKMLMNEFAKITYSPRF